MNEEEKNELSKDKQFVNLLLGVFYYILCVAAFVWILFMWWQQWQNAKRKGKRSVPQWPKSITFLSENYSMNNVGALLKQYHVHSFPFVLGWTEYEGCELLECSVLVPASQFDYADAILHQHGVALLSGAGSKRGQNVGQPRNYTERRPETKDRRSTVKLGKTYR